MDMRPTGCGLQKKLKYLNKKIILTTNYFLLLLILTVTFFSILFTILQSNLHMKKQIIADSGFYSQLSSTVTLAALNFQRHYENTINVDGEKEELPYLFFFKSQIDKAISFSELHKKFDFEEDFIEIQKIYKIDKTASSNEKKVHYLLVEDKYWSKNTYDDDLVHIE